MTTIISTGGALGNHRCDARCHTGDKRRPCTCICGGRYHGVGSSERAQRMLTQDWYDGAVNFDAELRLTDQAVQASLFTEVTEGSQHLLPRLRAELVAAGERMMATS